jgi:hypothetical protein
MHLLLQGLVISPTSCHSWWQQLQIICSYEGLRTTTEHTKRGKEAAALCSFFASLNLLSLDYHTLIPVQPSGPRWPPHFLRLRQLARPRPPSTLICLSLSWPCNIPFPHRIAAFNTPSVAPYLCFGCSLSFLVRNPVDTTSPSCFPHPQARTFPLLLAYLF